MAHRTLEWENNSTHVSLPGSQSNHWAASDRKCGWDLEFLRYQDPGVSLTETGPLSWADYPQIHTL